MIKLEHAVKLRLTAIFCLITSTTTVTVIVQDWKKKSISIVNVNDIIQFQSQQNFETNKLIMIL